MKVKALLIAAMALSSLTLGAREVRIGWAECDITPSLDCGKKIPLTGQYYVREANGIHSRLKFTVCAMRQGDEHVIMGSLDNVSSNELFVRRVAEELHKREPAIKTENFFISAIHTHAAPQLKGCYEPESVERWQQKNPGFLNAREYADLIFEDVVNACLAAFREAKPGKFSRAFGNARVGHCRLVSYRDGSCEMYGDAQRDDFAGMLEGEDSGVEMLFTEDMKGNKTGVFVNAACPAQVMELLDVVSSDFSGALRDKLQGEYGKNFHMIYHYGHGGDQGPRDLTRSGQLTDGFDGWHADAVEAISNRLLFCVKEGMANSIECPPVLRHSRVDIALPLRRVTPEDVALAKKENEVLLAGKTEARLWDEYLADVALHQKDESRLPYDSKLHPYCVLQVNKAVISRIRMQEETPEFTITSHIVRIGDVAFASNPFELYLRYGQIIKSRSAAKQTFIICKSDGQGGYLPTEESEKAVGYSGGVSVGKIGHEGGFLFCDRTLEEIEKLFE